MTIAELEVTMPNGFHDAGLARIEIDIAAATAKLFFLLDVSGLSDSEVIPVPATVTLGGLSLLHCETACRWDRLDGRPLTVSGFNPNVREYPQMEALKPEVQVQLFGFFLLEWNTRLYIAAERATVEWAGAHDIGVLGN